MNIEKSTKPPVFAPAMASPATGSTHIKNRIETNAMPNSFVVDARWTSLIAEAKEVWEKVHPEDLKKVNGNFQKLAGLAQLRFQISREESDRQVRDFFFKHYPVA